MAFDFLTPVPDKVLAHCELLPDQALGNKMIKHTQRDGLPELQGMHVAFLGIQEVRNAFTSRPEALDIQGIRLEFYKLMQGNWGHKIVDLGDVAAGATVEDTFYVVRELVAALVAQDIIPLLVGGTQELTFPLYRGFDQLRKRVNLVAVDSRFDFGHADELISSNSYMSKIIEEEPHNLFNFSNLGYQVYFNSQEELDLMERLFFDAYRLGVLNADITLAEPVLRNAHILSLDARAVKASELGNPDQFSPNGFSGPEICAIARYAGLGSNLMAFGLFEAPANSQGNQLMAQIMWYFLEGLNYRSMELPHAENPDFTKYLVPLEDHELIFYKSSLSQRWWVEVPPLPTKHNNLQTAALLPCTEQDYLEACGQDVPERWYKAYRKGFN